MSATTSTALFAACVLAAATGTAHAQCEPETFDAFSPGTIATNLVPGVTISAGPGSCGGPGSVLPIIVSPPGGTSSGTRALGLETGCPDFSPDFLQLDFDEPQDLIEFTLGTDIPGGSVQVRWITSSGTLIPDIVVTAEGTHRLVRITTPNVVTVEIQSLIGDFESIDDLTFGRDTTEPLVEIDAPTFDACVCGDDILPVIGTVADDEGTYQCDTLSYRPVNADQSTPWTTIGTACGAFSGTLYNWSTVGVPEGRYYLRVTGTNSCGLSQTDITVVRVDRSFGTAVISAPAEDESVCGTIDIDGAIVDGCPGTWAVQYRPAAGGAFVTIASGNGNNDCTLTTWDTTTVPDGAYVLRATGTDACGYSEAFDRTVIVNNTDGDCLCTADIDGDGTIGINDLLILLANWGL